MDGLWLRDREDTLFKCNIIIFMCGFSRALNVSTTSEINYQSLTAKHIQQLPNTILFSLLLLLLFFIKFLDLPQKK